MEARLPARFSRPPLRFSPYIFTTTTPMALFFCDDVLLVVVHGPFMRHDGVVSLLLHGHPVKVGQRTMAQPRWLATGTETSRPQKNPGPQT